MNFFRSLGRRSVKEVELTLKEEPKKEITELNYDKIEKKMDELLIKYIGQLFINTNWNFNLFPIENTNSTGYEYFAYPKQEVCEYGSRYINDKYGINSKPSTVQRQPVFGTHLRENVHCVNINIPENETHLLFKLYMIAVTSEVLTPYDKIQLKRSYIEHARERSYIDSYDNYILSNEAGLKLLLSLIEESILGELDNLEFKVTDYVVVHHPLLCRLEEGTKVQHLREYLAKHRFEFRRSEGRNEYEFRIINKNTTE